MRSFAFWLVGFAFGLTPILAQENSIWRHDCTAAIRLPHSFDTKVNGFQSFYAGPTQLYQHGVLGDTIEAKSIYVRHKEEPLCARIAAGKGRVFEDTDPRLMDVTGDGIPEIITVASDIQRGARLEIYALNVMDQNPPLLAHTPYIGQSHRWLAPIAAADLDGDGHVEVAYIDRPHLAKTLQIWRYKKGAFTFVAKQSALSNHRIGHTYITGGLRDCAGVKELITVNGNWTKIMATRFDGAKAHPRSIADYRGRDSVNAALLCS